MEVDIFDEDFQFALEMVILKRNKNGATLSEIKVDIDNLLGINSEALWGYKFWEQHIKPMLTLCMPNIRVETESEGCVLYYMDYEAALDKLSSELTDNMQLIVQELNIDLVDLKKTWDAILSSKSASQTDSIRNDQPESTNASYSSASDDWLYDFLLIGDNFFLEMAHRELRQRLTKMRLKQVGYCVSGQSIRKAARCISRSIEEIRQSIAIINLGSIDLLQGRELVDMIQDVQHLCNTLYVNGISPILTTLPPLANQMHNKVLEGKRKRFNMFLWKEYDCIDIEKCFLNPFNCISFDLYQRDAKSVGGTRWPLVLWNNIGRQRVLRTLKRKIKDFIG